MLFLTLPVAACQLLLASFALADLDCRPEGPVVPRPRGLAQSTTLSASASDLAAQLNQSISGEINAGWVVENVSFSLAFISADQPDPAVPIWEYHHIAPANFNGSKTIDRNSQWLIGSISKIFSELLLLKSGIDIDEPVTKFLPKLLNSSSLISWENVTLRALGSQLSGTPPNYGFSEYYYLRETFQIYGFPPIPVSAYPPCGVVDLNGDCTVDQLLDGMITSHPITMPFERPAYSNVAFTLFMLAVEQVLGKSYTELLDEFVVQPLGLLNTLPSPGNDSRAIVPPVYNVWGANFGQGITTPGGGLVSSISDLSVLTQGILAGTILDTPSRMREWLKPDSLAGSQYTFVGLPWEIYRPPGLIPDHPHTVSIYGKAGGAYGYNNQMAILDEYGVGIIVLTAGDPVALPYIYDAVLSTLIPTVDAIARTQAQLYAQTFVSGCAPTNTTSIANYTCTVATVTQDRDSLILTSVFRNGQDVTAGIQKLWIFAVQPFIADMGPTFRIFPTEDQVPINLDGLTLLRESWRLWPDLIYPMDSDLPGRGLGSYDCKSWTMGDWLYYGSEPVDRIVFFRDEETNDIVGMEMPFLRSGFMIPITDNDGP